MGGLIDYRQAIHWWAHPNHTVFTSVSHSVCGFTIATSIMAHVISQHAFNQWLSRPSIMIVFFFKYSTTLGNITWRRTGISVLLIYCLIYINALGFTILGLEVHNIQNDIQNICALHGVVHGSSRSWWRGHSWSHPACLALLVWLVVDSRWVWIRGRWSYSRYFNWLECVQTYSY